MKKLIFIFACLVLAGCDNEDDCGCAPVQRDLDISLQDESGNPLINQDNFDQIETFYLNHGYENPLQDQPVFIDDPEHPRVKLFFHDGSEDEFPITYVRWNDSDTDTIKVKFNNRRTLIEKVWINEVLIENPLGQEFIVLTK